MTAGRRAIRDRKAVREEGGKEIKILNGKRKGATNVAPTQSNPPPRPRRGGPISKHTSEQRTNKNLFLVTDRVGNQE
jgi:hypothetical protein